MKLRRFTLWSKQGEYIMATLAEIRAKLAQQESKASGYVADNSIFAHWNMPENSNILVRFLPDGDESNTFFWVEKSMIRLPFSGVKDQPGSKPVLVQVPCTEMWGETCPILTEVRTWFKDKSLEEMGRKYWKKRSYIMQGLVVDRGSFKEENVPENPIRRFIISPQLFNNIKSALMDPDMVESPTDYIKGTDFRISKTTKGNYADYSTSNYARRERPLSEDELEAVEKYGLNKLGDFLPKRPTELELKVMKEMFEASVNGEAYDNSKWGQFFRPSGFGANSDADSVESSTPATAKVVSNDDVKEEIVKSAPAADTSASSKRAEDILNAIKARQNKKA